MEKNLLRALQIEAYDQCRYAKIATLLIDSQKGASNDILWFGIQAFLISSANLSKLFWGAGGDSTREAAREPLRASVGITKGSPLKDVTLRNDFEHYDEKLEKWFRESRKHDLAVKNVMPHNQVKGVSKQDRQHWYDAETGVLTFWTHSVSLVRLNQEIERILPLLKAEVEKPLGS